MAPEENNKRNRLLWDFDDVLWGLLKREAMKRKRSAPRQLEEILEERYRPDNLTDDEIAEALMLATTNERNREQIEPTPKKTAKKRANGPKR